MNHYSHLSYCFQSCEDCCGGMYFTGDNSTGIVGPFTCKCGKVNAEVTLNQLWFHESKFYDTIKQLDMEQAIWRIVDYLAWGKWDTELHENNGKNVYEYYFDLIEQTHETANNARLFKECPPPVGSNAASNATE